MNRDEKASVELLEKNGMISEDYVPYVVPDPDEAEAPDADSGGGAFPPGYSPYRGRQDSQHGLFLGGGGVLGSTERLRTAVRRVKGQSIVQAAALASSPHNTRYSPVKKVTKPVEEPVDADLVEALEERGLEALLPFLRKVGIASLKALKLRTVSEVKESLSLQAGKGKTYVMPSFEIRQLRAIGLELGDPPSLEGNDQPLLKAGESLSEETEKAFLDSMGTLGAGAGVGAALDLLGMTKPITIDVEGDSRASVGKASPDLYQDNPLALKLLGGVLVADLDAVMLKRVFDTVATRVRAANGVILDPMSESLPDMIDAIEVSLAAAVQFGIMSEEQLVPSSAGMRSAVKHVASVVAGATSVSTSQPDTAGVGSESVVMQAASVLAGVNAKSMSAADQKIAEQLDASKCRVRAVSNAPRSLEELKSLAGIVNSKSASSIEKMQAYSQVVNKDMAIAELMVSAHVRMPEGADALDMNYVACVKARAAARNGVIAAAKLVLKPMLPLNAESKHLIEAASSGMMASGSFDIRALAEPGKRASWIGAAQQGAARQNSQTKENLLVVMLTTVHSLVYAMQAMQPWDTTVHLTMAEVLGVLGRCLRSCTVEESVDVILGTLFANYEEQILLFQASVSCSLPTLSDVWESVRDDPQVLSFINSASLSGAATGLQAKMKALEDANKSLKSKVDNLSGDEGGGGGGSKTKAEKAARDLAKKEANEAKKKADAAELKAHRAEKAKAEGSAPAAAAPAARPPAAGAKP